MTLSSAQGGTHAGAPFIPDIAHLGMRGALYLLALVKAHHECQRVTATPEGTEALIRTLQTLGIVRLSHSQGREVYTTVGDRVSWIYIWGAIPFAKLERELTAHLKSCGRLAQHAPTWRVIWLELIPIEIVAYFRYQLRIHQFDPALLSEIEPFLSRLESCYSLGQWRYASWATVRSMASTALQYPGNSDIIRFTLVNELARRLRLTQEAGSDKLCFSPARSTPASALTNVFSTIATDLGDEFWRHAPTLALVESSIEYPTAKSVDQEGGLSSR